MLFSLLHIIFLWFGYYFILNITFQNENLFRKKFISTVKHHQILYKFEGVHLKIWNRGRPTLLLGEEYRKTLKIITNKIKLLLPSKPKELPKGIAKGIIMTHNNRSLFVTSVWSWNVELLPHYINSAENLIRFKRIIKKWNGAQWECTVCQNKFPRIIFITPFNTFVTTTLHPSQFLLIHNCFYQVELSSLISNFICKRARFFWYPTENEFKWNEMSQAIRSLLISIIQSAFTWRYSGFFIVNIFLNICNTLF